MGKLIVQFYSSTTIAASIVSSTLDNIGFVENNMSFRTWAIRPCCASTAIFVLRICQFHCPARTFEGIAPPVPHTLRELILFFLFLLLVLGKEIGMADGRKMEIQTFVGSLLSLSVGACARVALTAD